MKVKDKEHFREAMFYGLTTAAVVVVSVLFTRAEAYENALTDWEMGFADTNGQTHFDQYNGQDQFDYFQVPAEFAYDANWNGTFTDSLGNGTACANATGNSIGVSVEDSVATTIVLDSIQNNNGDQTASCNWYN